MPEGDTILRTVHSHLGMSGSWHLYRPGEPWRKRPESAALALEVEGARAALFQPKILEILSERALRAHRFLRSLGPDLLSNAFEESEALRRFRVHDVTPVGEAVMNQSIVSGIGNVYKSEVLFLERVDPFAPVGSLVDAKLRAILGCARELLRRNLDGRPRRTRFGRDGQRKWVYRRRGDPCLVCGEPVRMRRQGDLGRSTYWCPACQETQSP